MPKLLFDYLEAISLQKIGNEIDPVITINVDLGIIQGKYYDRIKRLDTGEAWTEYNRPVPFTIHLDKAGMQQMLGLVAQYASAQDVLRPANPVLEVPPPPVAPPPSIAVTVIPSTALVATGGAVQLAANVTNVPEGGTVAVEWFMRTGDFGSVDANGLYTAGTERGTFRVLARSVQDPTVVGYCDVTVD